MATDLHPPGVCGVIAAAVPVGSVLVMDPVGLAPFGPAKWAVVSSLVLALGACVLGRRTTSARLPLALWGAFLLVAGSSAAVGVDPLYAWTGTPERHFGVIAWVLCAVAFASGRALSHREIRLFAHAAAVVTGLVGAWAVAEALGWHPIALNGIGDRPGATFGSSAYLGAALALLCPAATGLAFARRSTLLATAATSGWVALVLTGARSAWVGAIVASLVWALARRVPVLQMAGVIAVAATLAVVLGVTSGVASRVPDLFLDQEGGARGRLDEWRVAVRVIGDHPLLGVGPEGYRIDFGRHVGGDYEREHGRVPLPDRAHSAPLDVAATTGVFGALVYVALLAAVARPVWQGLRSLDSWRAGAAAGLIAYGVQSLFLFPVAEIEPLAWLLVGVVVSGAVAHTERGARVDRPLRRFRQVLGVLMGTGAVAALGAGALDVAADRRAVSVLAGSAEPGAAVRLRPDAVRYYLAQARALEASGAPGRALLAIDKSLDRSPGDPVARSEQARLLLARAQVTGTADHLKAALRSLEHLATDDPRNAQVLLRFGVALALGHDPRAETVWLQAESLAPQSAAASVNLATFYERQGRTSDARAAARRAVRREPRNMKAREILRPLLEPDS